MKTTSIIKGILYQGKYRIVKHILFWLFIYMDEFLSLIGITAEYEIYPYVFLIELLGDMAFVYLNIYVLLPRFFLKGKVFIYIVLTLLSIVGLYLYSGIIYELEYDPEYFLSEIISFLFINTGMLGMAVAFKLIQSTVKSNEAVANLQQEQLSTELAYLKTQVNPHFLFNTLNNLYVLAQKNDAHVPDAILQLSDLLRYQLYECDAELVPLKKEIEYLNHYIDLEKLRRQDLDLVFNIKGPVESKRIPPLVLIPFVENAFKYSYTGGIGQARILIHIEAKDNEVTFSCNNTIGQLRSSEVGGIGLTNAKRRLELAYPDRHEINVNDGNGEFFVSLILKDL